MGRCFKTSTYVYPLHVDKSLETVYDKQQIVYTNPKDDNIHLKDVARMVKEYPTPDNYIINDRHKYILLSVKMKKA